MIFCAAIMSPLNDVFKFETAENHRHSGMKPEAWEAAQAITGRP